MTSWSAWDELARGEMTLTVEHGERELRTRILLRDGRMLEQHNHGLPESGEEWREVGRFEDLDATLRTLRKEGWVVRRADGRSISLQERA